MEGSEAERHSLEAHAAGANVGADVVIDGGRESQVEESVGTGPAGQRGQMGIELGEGGPLVIPAAQVGVSTEEGRQTLTLILRNLVYQFKRNQRFKKKATFLLLLFKPRKTEKKKQNITFM